MLKLEKFLSISERPQNFVKNIGMVLIMYYVENKKPAVAIIGKELLKIRKILRKKIDFVEFFWYNIIVTNIRHLLYSVPFLDLMNSQVSLVF